VTRSFVPGSHPTQVMHGQPTLRKELSGPSRSPSTSTINYDWLSRIDLLPTGVEIVHRNVGGTLDVALRKFAGRAYIEQDRSAAHQKLSFLSCDLLGRS